MFQKTLYITKAKHNLYKVEWSEDKNFGLYGAYKGRLVWSALTNLNLKMSDVQIQDWTTIDYFKPSEFRCKCCGKLYIDFDFVLLLNLIRNRAGIPFIITSGYRCPAHNKAVGGKTNSAHLYGKAADILVQSSKDRYLILEAALYYGVKRIGIAPQTSRRAAFIHIDTMSDDAHPSPTIWLYT